MGHVRRRNRRRRGRVPALVCGIVLLAAGCSGGGDDEWRHDALGRCATSVPHTPAASAPERKPDEKPDKDPGEKPGEKPKSPNRDDFDGDGRHDLLLAGAYQKPGSALVRHQALLLGAPGGAAAGRQVSLTDEVPGLKDAEAGEHGLSAITGDWDDDGRADILYDAPHDVSENGPPHHKEQIVWGAPGGVSGRPTALSDSAVRHVDSGDFDGDGATDLVSGPYKASKDARNEVRCVAVDFGPFTRDGEPQERRYADITRRGTVRTDAFTAGDFDGDGRTEFVTSGFREAGEAVPDESYPEYFVDVSYHHVGTDRSVSRTGGLKALGHGRNTHYDPETGGGVPNPLASSAASLTTRLTGDFGGNGRTDLIDEEQVYYGGAQGPGSGRAPTDTIRSDGKAVGDVNGDGRDDLVVSDHRDQYHRAGTVAVFLGGAHGLAEQAAHTFDRRDVGMAGRAKDDRARDSFGSGLALADLDGDGCDELAVLTQDFPGRGATGTYWIVPGGPRGPVPSRAVRLGSFVWIRPDQGAGSGACDRKAEEGGNAERWQPTTTPEGAPPCSSEAESLGEGVPDPASPA